jgi:hypothetical protein
MDLLDTGKENKKRFFDDMKNLLEKSKYKKEYENVYN